MDQKSCYEDELIRPIYSKVVFEPTYSPRDENGRTFAVQEYVEASTLGSLHSSRSISLLGNISVLTEVAGALHSSHMRGFLHLDLNLDNILVDKAGHAHVLDFVVLDPRPGAIFGRGGYIAPEMIMGENDFKGPRTDVWNLGVIMYQLLTGHLPFAGNIMEVRASLTGEAPPSPTSLDPAIPAEHNRICMTCLQKKKADRDPTAKAMADELRAWHQENTPLGRGQGQGKTGPTMGFTRR